MARGQVHDQYVEHNPLPSMVRQVHPTVDRIEIEDFPMIITRDGPQSAPVKIVKTLTRPQIDELAIK